MASNPKEPVTVPQLVAVWREQAALYARMSNPPSGADVAEMCARGLELLFSDRAASPLPAEPLPPLNSTYCDKLLFQVAGGGGLRCNAPKGHDGVCSYVTQYYTTDQPAITPPKPPFEVGRNPNIPRTCNACGRILLLENLYVDDGCPCNSARGVNFTPQPCGLCRLDYCVKPGHRLFQLFGVAEAATPSAAEPQKEE